MRDELDRLQQELVDGQELEKVKNKFESTQIFGNINYLNVATNLAWFELLGKAEDLEKEVERYRSVTAMQLREVAQSAFRKENGVVLYYKSKREIYIEHTESIIKHYFFLVYLSLSDK